MRIGVDATCWGNWRGYGRFARSLVRALLEIDRQNEYVLFFDSGGCGGFEPPPPTVRRVVVPTSRPATAAAAAESRRSLRDLLRMSLAVSREPLDLFFCPTVYGYFPLLGRWPKVIAVHDAIADTHPELVFPRRRHRWFWNAKVRLALFQADRIVTVSAHARRDVSRAFGIPEERIAVVYDAADDLFRPPASRDSARERARQRFGIRGRYLLTVGGFGPHKNLRMLLEAFANLARDPAFADLDWLLAGEHAADSFHSVYGELRREAIQRRLESRVRFLGFVPDPDLVLLYQAAEVLVLPSIREGFGLPGLEATCCGTPVVATRESALPEILGEAGIFFDPLDRAALEASLRAVLGDSGRAERMRRAAREVFGRSTWRHSAAEALAVFREFDRRQGR
jgi:glycosyltransferase involved in cell wall biosynthesis